MPKLKIDGQEIEVPKGTSIIQAAEQLGIEIPRFCYHDKLSVPANCRMCLVEVEGGPPKPVASCAMACGEDMVVHTDTEMVKKARKGVMEFLLINHPLDCPICDQGGECDLQDQAMAYGYDRSRYEENKRAVPDKDLGPLINTVMTRCIQCTRCVRFSDEIAGKSELGMLHRGEDSEINAAIEGAVSSELSGNMIDICPVGALTSKPYTFKARPWELRKTETIDVHDAVGCNIRVDARGAEVMRVLPRLHEGINEEWISDKTRFAYDGLLKRRLDRPWVRNTDSGKLEEASWDDALKLVASKMSETEASKRIALAGDLSDAESMIALKDLFELDGGATYESRIDGAEFDASERCGYLFNTGIEHIEDADAILLVGTNPRIEATMVNARIRKAYLRKQLSVALIGEEADLTYPYEHIGTTPAELEKLLKSRSGFAQILKDAERPMIIIGMSAFQREDAKAVHALCRSVAEKFDMVDGDWNGFNVLHDAASRVAALDIGYASSSPIDLKSQRFVYLLGADFDMSAISKKAFVVYQGHHGDAGAHRADVILPGAAYTEKSGTYINTEGRVQHSRRSVFPPGEAKEDWTVIRALSAYLGEDKTLPYNNITALRNRMVEEWPHFANTDVLPFVAWDKFGDEKMKLTAHPFHIAIDNFYLTNPIARASSTMLKCVESFIDENDRMKDAAE